MTKAQASKARSLMKRYEALNADFYKLADQINPLAFLTSSPPLCLSDWIREHDSKMRRAGFKSDAKDGE